MVENKIKIKTLSEKVETLQDEISLKEIKVESLECLLFESSDKNSLSVKYFNFKFR